MLAAVWYGPRDLRIEEVPEPEPGPGQVLIEVSRNGICGSDLHTYVGSDTGAASMHVPGVVLGHEFAGTVGRGRRRNRRSADRHGRHRRPHRVLRVVLVVPPRPPQHLPVRRPLRRLPRAPSRRARPARRGVPTLGLRGTGRPRRHRGGPHRARGGRRTRRAAGADDPGRLGADPRGRPRGTGHPGVGARRGGVGHPSSASRQRAGGPPPRPWGRPRRWTRPAPASDR